MGKKLDDEATSSRITGKLKVLGLDTARLQMLEGPDGLPERGWEGGLWDECYAITNANGVAVGTFERGEHMIDIEMRLTVLKDDKGHILTSSLQLSLDVVPKLQRRLLKRH